MATRYENTRSTDDIPETIEVASFGEEVVVCIRYEGDGFREHVAVAITRFDWDQIVSELAQ